MSEDRMKCHFSITDIGKDNQVYIDNDKIVIDYFTIHEEILIQEIERIKLSLVNRIYNHSDILVEKGISLKTLLQGDTRHINVKYYIDLDIITATKTIHLESEDLLKPKELINTLSERIEEVEDPVGVVSLLNIYEDINLGRSNIEYYLIKNYPKFARKYGLENPRTKNPLLYDILKNS